MNIKTKEKANQGLVERRGEAEVLIAQAIDKNVPVEALERLLVMRRELKQERAKELFFEALTTLQAKLPIIHKSTVVKNKDGTVRYRYAPLDEILKQTRGAIKENGFSYVIDAHVEDGFVTALCKAIHAGGHEEVSSFKVPVDRSAYMNSPQQFAAALTFAKRYAFCNAFGILTGDEDNDADSIAPQNHKGSETGRTNGEARAEALVTQKQVGFIKVLLEKKGHSEKELFVKYEVSDVSELSRAQASTIIENLQRLPDVDMAEEIASDAMRALA